MGRQLGSRHGRPVLPDRYPPIPVGRRTNVAQSAWRIVRRIVGTGIFFRVAHATPSLDAKLKAANQRDRETAKLRAHATADNVLLC